MYSPSYSPYKGLKNDPCIEEFAEIITSIRIQNKNTQVHFDSCFSGQFPNLYQFQEDLPTYPDQTITLARHVLMWSETFPIEGPML